MVCIGFKSWIIQYSQDTDYASSMSWKVLYASWMNCAWIRTSISCKSRSRACITTEVDHFSCRHGGHQTNINKFSSWSPHPIVIIFWHSMHTSMITAISSCRSPWTISQPYHREYTRGVHPMLGQWWRAVADGGPSLTRHWVNVSCLLLWTQPERDRSSPRR